MLTLDLLCATAYITEKRWTYDITQWTTGTIKQNVESVHQNISKLID